MLNKFLTIFLITLLFFSGTVRAQALIIDTDMAGDDVMAITYLLLDKSIDVKAMTIAATGQAHCLSALENVTGILQLTKKRNIPIACGASTPLKGSHHFPAFARQDADTLAGTARLLPKVQIAYPKEASSLLVKTLQNIKYPIDVLAIGPLTNLAQLFLAHPELKNKIHRIYIMGGAIDVPGNISALEHENSNQFAEWNIYVDPVAAYIVFHSGVPITLISLDLVNQLPVDENFYQKLHHAKHTLASKYIDELLTREFHLFKEQWYFWDVLAAVIASDPSFTIIKTKKINIVTAAGSKQGATIRDEKNGVMVQVATSVDKEKFKLKFLQTITAAN